MLRFAQLAGIALLVLILAVLLTPGGRRLIRSRVGSPPHPSAINLPVARPVPAVPEHHPALSPNGEEPSHIADDLNSPRTDIHADLRIVNELFDQYRSATHALNPVGENKDITAALAGNNSLGFSFLAPDSPAINAKGLLVDRWGTPFFFHQLSGDQMQIRSAGPDRKLYTDDDEVLTPGLYAPHL